MSLDSNFSNFTARLREFMDFSLAGADSDQEFEFERLALELFALQFERNSHYRRFCESQNVSTLTIERWEEIQVMPTTAFKELDLSCLPSRERTSVFHSSGTTGQRPSRHFHNAQSLSIYETSLLSWFFRAAFPGGRPPIANSQGKNSDTSDWRLVILTPPPAQAQHSSLVHMFDTLRRAFGVGDTVFLGRTGPKGGWSLDLERTVAVLNECSKDGLRVLALGTAFSFVHVLDYLAAQRLVVELPPGSLVLETGGYKGLSRSLPKAELHSLITERLGVPPSDIICEYGMSELSSQAYDRSPGLGSQTRSEVASQHPFHFPPWAKVQVVSPETGGEVGEGEIGLLRIFDLANVYSVMAIQTEDLGIRRKEGFELLGRAEAAELRGCSLMAV